MTRNSEHRGPAVSLATNADVAASLVERGVPVLPLSADKRPLTPRGFHDAHVDDGHWRRSPGALLGIPTAEFWVLDLDAPLDVSVPALLALLRCEWQELTARCGLMVKTPGAGLHLYWSRTPGLAIRTAAGEIAPGIDTRGHDAEGKPTGYIVAPGCVLPDGRRYVVEHGSLDALREAPPGLLWLASLSRRDRTRVAADPRLTAAVRAAPLSAWRGILDAHDKASRPLQVSSFGPEHGTGMRCQALHDLDAERRALAVLREGRRAAVFGAAARLARYAANDMLTAHEIEAGLMDGWIASGAAGKHGTDYPRGAIRRGLDKGRNDSLPPLMRRFRTWGGAGR